MQYLRAPLEVRFWRKVNKTETCWLWTGAKRTGYGMIRDKTKPWSPYAHRLSWEFKHGPIPDGMNVCHRCDVPLCVNPDHLFLGTDSDNFLDMHRKGRYRPHMPPRFTGQDHPQSKLTDSDVRDIKKRLSASVPIERIAKSFNVSHAAIRYIAKGVTWKHIT